MNKLPEKPSELILVALHDLELCELDPDYVIKMSDWHRYHESIGKCYVCLAGSIMAKNLNIDKDSHILVPQDLGNELGQTLDAVDDLRWGDVSAAFEKLKLSFSLGQKFNRRIEHYRDNPLAFKLDMTMLAFDLWEAGY